ncbi:MAG: DUF523 domain-containing protein, partial [Erysipelotrichia bacterium]|nr:DUF523 domain-containing protein [Erysipelotrichia bacterium]
DLLEKYELVPFCPEVAGGLRIPRPISEQQKSRHKIMNTKGQEVTAQFVKGAELAYNICLYLNIRIAILKERSPSCGTHQVYDGSFTKKLIPGMGVTTAYLKSKGLLVLNEDEIATLLEK